MAAPGSDSLSLGGVADLSLERRCAYVHRASGTDMDAVMRRLHDEMPDVHRVMSVERLAWAVAFNVTGEPAAPRVRVHRGKRSYLDYWTPDTPWSKVWSSLAAPTETGPSGLIELATSVACERRDDWQHASARPVQSDLAHAAFAAVYDRQKDKVIGYVTKQFRRRAGDPQDVATEAWSRAFLDYWSEEAHKRVLGTSAISSLVCGIAYFIGCDALRHEKSLADEQAPGVRGPAEDQAAGGPGDQVLNAELERHVKQCREQLPTRQQMAARMAWDHELRQNEVARRLGVSPPAVSQLLEKARGAMKKCLGSKGLVGTT